VDSQASNLKSVVDAFEYDAYRKINEARWGCFANLLEIIRRQILISTALDIGCGIGYFSKQLQDIGLQVTAIDGREINIAELTKRYPYIKAAVKDVQIPTALDEYRGVDLVFCVGLIYHLENPFSCIRNIGQIHPKVVILESQILPSDKAKFQIVDEGEVPNQSLNYVALIPSRLALIKMLYKGGFSYVFESKLMPNHEDFREDGSHYQRRTILVASDYPLSSDVLTRCEEPVTPKLTFMKNATSFSWRNLLRKLKGQFLKLVNGQ
jgi:SAM-dependent methyltransferase